MAEGGPQQRIVESSYFRSSKYSEVLFPNEFAPNHPWGDLPTECPVKIESFRVKIENFVHTTHEREEFDIIETKKFEAGPKFGKKLGAFDGSPCGESFKYDDGDYGCGGDRYVQIFSNETVFNGHFSWWGIIPTPATRENLQEELQLKKPKETDILDVADYLKPEPESRYGGYEFQYEVSTLLEFYAQSRGTTVTNVYMRVGGTLRYRNEICYVIILCTDQDQMAMNKYDPLPPISGPFNFENFINEDGKILGEDEKRGEEDTPTFSPKYVVTQFNRDYYSYETVAFAFYFPPSGITIPQGTGLRSKNISHEKCMRGKKCPDKRMM